MTKPIAANRVPSLLRLHAHDPERQLFACDDRSLAFGFLCRPLSGGDDATEQRLRSFLALDWPTGTLLGFHLLASSAIHQLVQQMIALRAHETDPLLAMTIHDRAEHLLAGVDAPYPETGTLVRDFQLVVTAKLPQAGPQPTEPEMVAAHGHQRRARQALEDLQLLPKIMSAGDACFVLNQLLCRGPHATWRRLPGMDIHDDLLLAEQAVDSDLDLQVERDGIWLGQSRLAVLSVKSFPGMLRFGMTAGLIGDLRQGQRGLKAPFLITTSVYYPDPQQTEARLAKRRAWTTHQLHSPLQRWLPNLAGRAADLDAMVMSLEEGHRPVQLATTLLLYGRDAAEAERAVTAATAYWSEVRFNAPPDRYVCLPLFLQALPFNADRESIPDLGRYRTMTTQHAARLLPVFAEWPGSGTPALTFVSRQGQLIRFDLFDSRTNYNATIAAESGSGKSFLANYLITSYLSLGAQVFVIDVGKSYQNLCELLGGSFIDVADPAVGLNPFPLVQHYETHTGLDGGIEDGEGDVLEALLGAMAAETEPLTDFQRQTLSRVMHTLWARHGPNMTIDQISHALIAEDDQRACDIGIQLFAFTSHGSFGRFFAGANTMRLDNRLVVLELEHLKQRKHLQRVVLLQLIYQIQQAMYVGDRSRRKIVIIDEAWDLLTSGEVGKFIETGYRRFRKYNGAAIVITQSLGDLYNNPVGEAITANSAITFQLAQQGRTLEMLAGQQKLPGGIGLDTLKSIHTAPGRYAELAIMSNQGSGVARLVVSPFLQLLYSTRAEDVAAIAALRGQGLSLTAAIETLVQRRQRQAAA